MNQLQYVIDAQTREMMEQEEKVKNIIISLLMIATLAISLSACGSTGNDDKVKDLEDKVIDFQNQLDEVKEEEPKEETSAQELPEEPPKQELPEEAPGMENAEKEEGSISDEDIFMQFINGETTAMVDGEYQDALNYAGVIYDFESGNTSYTFDNKGTISYKQLISAVEESDISRSDSVEIKTYYAITNTLSGKPALAVKFENLGIYASDDDSYALFLFVVNGGQLYMTYAYDSWARNWVEIHDNLVFTGYGSGGAGDIFDWCFYIDETGHYKSVYERESLYAEWVASYGSYELGMDNTTFWSQGCIVSLLTTSDGSYYWYEADDSVDTEQLAIFTNLLEGNDMSRIDSVEDVINLACEANGISADSLSDFDDWIQKK